MPSQSPVPPNIRRRPRFSREFDFVINATRLVRTGQQALLADAIAPDLDWTTVVPGIARHGMIWLIPSLLQNARPIPREAETALRTTALSQAIDNLRVIDEAVLVSRALSARNIRFLVIKGVPLSVQLHGNTWRRAGRDIDIVVERTAAVAAGEVLAALQYDLLAGAGSAPQPYGTIAKETGYIHRDKRIIVEMHDRLTDNPTLIPWNFEILWSERDVLAIGGEQIPTLSSSRLPLYLCVHGAKHCWARLIWLEDLASALNTPTAIDRAFEDADRLGLSATMLHALFVLHEWLGHPIPEKYLRMARKSHHVQFLNGIIHQFHADPQWYEQPRRGSWRKFREDSIQGRLMTYAMKPNWQYWRKQLASELYSPADRRMMELPDRLAWLYPAMRPFGWIVRRLRGNA